jgi:hypothetical protein
MVKSGAPAIIDHHRSSAVVLALEKNVLYTEFECLDNDECDKTRLHASVAPLGKDK